MWQTGLEAFRCTALHRTAFYCTAMPCHCHCYCHCHCQMSLTSLDDHETATATALHLHFHCQGMVLPKPAKNVVTRPISIGHSLASLGHLSLFNTIKRMSASRHQVEHGGLRAAASGHLGKRMGRRAKETVMQSIHSRQCWPAHAIVAGGGAVASHHGAW